MNEISSIEKIVNTQGPNPGSQPIVAHDEDPYLPGAADNPDIKKKLTISSKVCYCC